MAAAAAVATASHMPSAKAATVATAKAARVRAAESAWMAESVMVLPGIVIGEIRPVPSSIDRPSIGVGSVAIAWIAVVAIARFATSARREAEQAQYQR
jgi:hypothetical protein